MIQDLPMTPQSTKQTELQGLVEHITFANEENGYTIAKIKVSGQKGLVTAVGYLMSPTPGEVLKMKGEWMHHDRYGDQFKVLSHQTAVPATVYGIKKYLGSGLIKGVGPMIAERIVKKFGEETLNIIESNIETLAEVEGIGKKRIAMIQKAWEDQKEVRDVMVFLQAHSVSSTYAAKIFKEYGKESIVIVKENPYRLATDIFGIGFITADRIAANLGFPKDSPLRAEAGILYVLHELSNDGHVYYPYEPLIKKATEILDVDRNLILDALGRLTLDSRIVIEDLNRDMETFLENNKAVYLHKFHFCETRIAARIKVLLYVPKSIRSIHAEKAVEWVQTKLSISLAEKQKEAILSAISQKVLVITGGPGTGKTTIINAVLKIYSALNIHILLAAPTGRAAKRMTETTGHLAKTIHRMLEYSMAQGGFQKNEDSLLKCDLLILDEASMIDTILMHHLLKAVPNSATLILVGDVNQLPSVGAGNILKDIIESRAVPVVELNEIFRQAKQSRIIVNAHRINRGEFPVLDHADPVNDFFFMQKESPEEVLKTISELVHERLPKRYGLDPVNDIQVLTPMNKGIVGTMNLNTELQNILNPSPDILVRGGRHFRIGDKVMQIKNNYDKEVYNGDIGRIIRLNTADQELILSFDGREVPYDFTDLDEVNLAYAVSVHKSQGSEYPVVVIPIVIQHYMLLQRNLIYTAITRGKKLVVIVGTKKALMIGIKNDETQKRYSGLADRMAG